MKRKAVFLDRDGVLNRSIIVEGKPKPPKRVSELVILDGVVEAIRLLLSYELLPVVISNQPDVARGKILEDEVNEINNYLGETLNLKHFYTCFHDDTDLCVCRKPLPGLINRAAIELNIDVHRSYLIGDRWRDIEASHAAGCQPYFIDYSYSEKAPKTPFIKVSSLMEAANLIIGEINEINK